ncbi:MAG: Mur ligase domain-containing protein, partial [Burkholderiaceae bacterium]|nr:Mur ligase domain-containing protein [Burkholderiaceae bacterium]
MMRVAELAASIAGARLIGDGSAQLQGVVTDTRQPVAGCAFFALRGARFDGHDFVAAAAAAGAVVAVVQRPVSAALPQIVVADTRRALGMAAAAW